MLCNQQSMHVLLVYMYGSFYDSSELEYCIFSSFIFSESYLVVRQVPFYDWSYSDIDEM